MCLRLLEGGRCCIRLNYTQLAVLDEYGMSHTCLSTLLAMTSQYALKASYALKVPVRGGVDGRVAGWE